MILIDPPSPFASRQEWQEFLDEMESIEPRTAEIEKYIKLAKDALRDA